ncbi:hypothetical protein RvY_00435 [Ramazzottius varieornatus]|uniref:Uncharacterized protein n=1 Tax=Ramazzottius varieornatus TaxID=947166 RepID=A0A1D1UD83_RAMVA|nr:hypothetical protein RvY_00435 [Ramazzottius varieornatus]
MFLGLDKLDHEILIPPLTPEEQVSREELLARNRARWTRRTEQCKAANIKRVTNISKIRRKAKEGSKLLKAARFLCDRWDCVYFLLFHGTVPLTPKEQLTLENQLQEVEQLAGEEIYWKESPKLTGEEKNAADHQSRSSSEELDGNAAENETEEE